jgi:uncharacterized protein (DUF433 family)
MVASVQTEHPYVVRCQGPGGEQAWVKGTRLSVALIAALFNRGETTSGILAMYPRLTPAALYDALFHYFDHKAEIDAEIAGNDPDQVIARLRSDPGLAEVSPGKFPYKQPMGSGVDRPLS